MSVRAQIKKARVEINLGANRNKDWGHWSRGETPKMIRVIMLSKYFSEPRN